MRLYELIKTTNKVNGGNLEYRSGAENRLVYVKEKSEFYKIKKIYTSCNYCRQRKESKPKEELCREYILEDCNGKKFYLICTPRYDFELVKTTKKEKLQLLLNQEYDILNGDYN